MAVGRRVARWNTVVAFLLIAVIAAADIAIGTMAVLIGALSVGPLVASLYATTAQTGAAALTAVLVGVVLGWPDGIAGDLDHVIRIGVVAVAGLIAIQAAHQRRRREEVSQQLARVAEVAQEVMLRPPPARLAHLAIAAHYVSASDVARVGGDLYETAYTSTGVRLVIGDVRGKGLDGIRMAATVLAAFRETVWAADLVTVARNLDDRVMKAAVDEEFVTALLAEIGPDGGVTIVNLGHHAPIRVAAHGVEELQTPAPTLPLGLGPEPRPEHYEFVTGDRLLLFTDGLVEARDEEGRFFRLLDHADTLRATDVHMAVDALVARLFDHVPGRLPDDMAVLLAELLPTDAPAEEVGVD